MLSRKGEAEEMRRSSWRCRRKPSGHPSDHSPTQSFNTHAASGHPTGIDSTQPLASRPPGEVKVKVLVAQPCPTLCDPRTSSSVQAPLSIEFFVCVCMCACMCVHLYVCFSHSVMSDSVTPRTVTHQAPLSKEFSRQEYWSGLPFPSPRDLPNPGLNLRLLCLPHCRHILYHLSLQKRPWVRASPIYSLEQKDLGAHICSTGRSKVPPHRGGRDGQCLLLGLYPFC